VQRGRISAFFVLLCGSPRILPSFAPLVPFCGNSEIAAGTSAFGLPSAFGFPGLLAVTSRSPLTRPASPSPCRSSSSRAPRWSSIPVPASTSPAPSATLPGAPRPANHKSPPTTYEQRFLDARRVRGHSGLTRPHALRSEAPRLVRHEHARRARSTETGLAWLWSTRSARARATHCPCAPEG